MRSVVPGLSLRARVVLALAVAALVPAIAVAVLVILHVRAETARFGATTFGDELAGGALLDLLVVVVVALPLAIAAGWLLATRLIQPLRALASRANAIASGDVSEPPPVQGPGELGELGARLAALAQRIREQAAQSSALARGDRLAAVSVMAAQLAHDINNPLTTVLGYAMLLQEGKPAGDPDLETLVLIASEAERMKSIVDGLLAHARVHRGPREPAAASPRCNPEPVLRALPGLLEAQLRRTRTSLTIRTAAPGSTAPLGPLAIEGLALQQIVVGLAHTAAQAMASATIEGTVAIAASPLPGGVATRITVGHDGPSVPATERARAFDPLLAGAGVGTEASLALAVCKHITVSAGGTIEVGEDPHGRAEVRVVIPRAPAGRP